MPSPGEEKKCGFSLRGSPSDKESKPCTFHNLRGEVFSPESQGNFKEGDIVSLEKSKKTLWRRWHEKWPLQDDGCGLDGS